MMLHCKDRSLHNTVSITWFHMLKTTEFNIAKIQKLIGLYEAMSSIPKVYVLNIGNIEHAGNHNNISHGAQQDKNLTSKCYFFQRIRTLLYFHIYGVTISWKTQW